MSNTMPIISIDTTFFWQIINFILLLFIFNKYFRKPISKIIAERKKKIEDDFRVASSEKSKAEELFKEAETKVENSKKEAIEIIKTSERKAEEEASNIIQEAKNNREKILKEAEYEAKKIEEKMKLELNSEVKTLAAELAEKLIKEKIDTNQENSLIDQFITEVGEENGR